MPKYDFECQKCSTTFEITLKISEKDGPHEKKCCPKCDSKVLKQIISFNGAISTGKSINSAPSCPTGTCPFAR